MRHFENVAANGFALVAFFGINSGKRTRRIHKCEYRQLEFFGGFHQPQRLAIAFWFAHAEVAHGAHFCAAAFLMTQYHAGATVETRQSANDGKIIGHMTIPMKFHKIGEDAVEIVQRIRPVGVAGNLRDLPGREIAVDVLGQLLAFFAKLFNFGRNIHCRFTLHIPQLLDLVFKFGNGLLKIQKSPFVHTLLPRNLAVL